MHDVGTVQEASILLPAASQGAIGIECRAYDARAIALLGAVDHAPTHRAVAAERAFLAALGGDCRSPVAAHADWREDGALRLDAEIFSEEGADHAAGHILLTEPDAPATGDGRKVAGTRAGTDTGQRHDPATGARDRKSTRLNSSH